MLGFYLLGALSIVLALLMVFARNPIHCVLYLIATFFMIAGQYVLLNAQFLAAVHIIVYAGAIMVLFLFVLMMLNLNRQNEPVAKNTPLRLAGMMAAGLFMIVMLGAFRSSAEMTAAQPTTTSDVGLVENLGKVLFTEYVVPFEIAGILFLAAMVGAVLVSKRDLQQ